MSSSSFVFGENISPNVVDDEEIMTPHPGRQTPICQRRPLQQRFGFNCMALSPTKRRKQSHSEESPLKLSKDECSKSVWTPYRSEASSFSLWLEVFRRLGAADIVTKAAPVCRQWREVAQGKELWALAHHLRLVDQFVVMEKLVERRSKGRIFKCRRLGSGDVVLLRMVDLELTNAGKDDGIPTSFIREAALLSELRHPNVIRHFGAEVLDKRAVTCTEFVQESWTSWFKKLEVKSPLQRIEDIRENFMQMLTGLNFLHHQGLMHRNLKPDNIFIDQAGTVKIGDFTTTRMLDIPFLPYTPEDPKERDRSGREMRRLWYRCPEIILRDEIYGPKVDTWSVGCLFVEASTGRTLLQSDSEIDHLFRIFRLVGTPTLDSWPEVIKAKNFSPLFPMYTGFSFAQVARAECLGIKGDEKRLLLQAQPDREDFVLHLMQTARVVGVEGMFLIDRTVTIPPSARATCEDILRMPFFAEPRAPVLDQPFNAVTEQWLRGCSSVSQRGSRMHSLHDMPAVSVLPDQPDQPPVAIPSSLITSEMVWNILNVMLEQEKNSCTLDSWSMPPDFDADARAVQVDFILGLATSLSLRDGTAHLACTLFDKYLTLQKPVIAEQIKVVASTCLKVADCFAEQSKEYYKQENAQEYADAAIGKSITPLQILTCEKELLPKLGFKLHHPTIQWFLQCYIAYARLSMRDAVGKTASFIADLMLLDFQLLSYAPSLKAQCAVLMAAFLVQEDKSHPSLAGKKKMKLPTHLEQSNSVSAPSQGKISLLEHWDSQIRDSVCRANSAVDASMCLQEVVRMLSDKRREWKSLQLNAVEAKHAQIARAMVYPDRFPILKLVHYILPNNERNWVPEWGHTLCQRAVVVSNSSLDRLREQPDQFRKPKIPDIGWSSWTSEITCICSILWFVPFTFLPYFKQKGKPPLQLFAFDPQDCEVYQLMLQRCGGQNFKWFWALGHECCLFKKTSTCLTHVFSELPKLASSLNLQTVLAFCQCVQEFPSESIWSEKETPFSFLFVGGSRS